MSRQPGGPAPRRLGRFELPWLVATLAAAVVLGGLLVGYEPVGGDPDRLYRPLKSELARALRSAQLPFWSDRLGTGIPLVAESHVAAFYPLNWALYGLLDVRPAYRLAMWLHYLALVGTTYLYARSLNLAPWGSALAGLSFTFCGFQAIHSSHEPFYHAVVYLPLALWLAERYLARGGLVWMVLLGLAWGVQLTLGHFQLQMWTGCLVLITAAWRVAVNRQPWQRGLGLIAALGWGAALAAVQLGLTWEFARAVGSTHRAVHDLMYYAYPPAHWAELVVPRWLMNLKYGPEDPYWTQSQQSTGYEACLYVGTVPLLLAFIGLFGRRRDRSLDIWLVLIPLSLALATMPQWWPAGYRALLTLPGLGYFRAPGRYTLIPSLGLALLAGRGLDRTIPTRRFALGSVLAVLFAVAAVTWVIVWSRQSALHTSLPEETLTWVLAEGALAWLVAMGVVLAWRRGMLGGWAPCLAAATELGILYYAATTQWGWSIELPQQSPVLARLALEKHVGRVAGHFGNLPVWAGQAPAYPYLGMDLPAPHAFLEPAKFREWSDEPIPARWLRRFGATYGVWHGQVDVPGVEVLFMGPDATLDRLVYRPPSAPNHFIWGLVRYAGVFPPARVALRAVAVPSEPALKARISVSDDLDEVYLLPEDAPAAGRSPRARSARLVAWDGRSGEVEHDGSCELVITRTYDPGWRARVDDGPELPVIRVDGGIQAVHLEGAGRSRIRMRYEPTWLRPAGALSAGTLLLALGTLGYCAIARRARHPASV